MTTPFAHEPNAVRSPEGDWVIFMTMRHPPGFQINCTERRAQSVEADGQQRTALPEPRHTYMTHSKTPSGPWGGPKALVPP